jgi:hypothetical protein
MEIMEDQAPVAMLPVGVEDIDEQDAYNTQMATEYVTEIYSYMRELEVSFDGTRREDPSHAQLNFKKKAKPRKNS